MNARHLYAGATLIALSTVAACGDSESGARVPTEIILQRATAFRQACAARQIEKTAAENLELLESSFGDASDGMASIRDAATGFARGYHRHAELRHALYALVDSAVNHARSAADSLRYEERANSFVVRVPAAGTVEANVMDAYERDFSSILADDDDPCNWNIPDLTKR